MQRRNPNISHHLVSTHFIHRYLSSGFGHLRLLFSSRDMAASCLSRGTIYYDSGSGGTGIHAFRVVEPLWDREVRRFFRSNRYGHSQAICKATQASCGQCAGEHPARDYDVSVLKNKCSNCSGPHQSGDPSCSVQIAAVRKYKSYLGQ